MLNYYSDPDENEEYLPLSKIFGNVRAGFEGMGILRLGFDPVPGNLSLGTLAFQMSFGLLQSLLEPRPKIAYYLLGQLDVAIDALQRQNDEKITSELEKTPLVPRDLTSLSLRQRWMFESFETEQGYSLGKDITELMLYLFDNNTRKSQWDQNNGYEALLMRILAGLQYFYSASSHDQEKKMAIHQFFDMTLCTRRICTKEGVLIGGDYSITFVDLIVKQPQLIQNFITIIAQFPAENRLNLLQRSLSANPTFVDTMLAELAKLLSPQCQPSNLIFLTLKNVINDGVSPTLEQIDTWIAPLPEALKYTIWIDILQHPTREVVQWLNEQLNANKILQKWRGACEIYVSDVAQKSGGNSMTTQQQQTAAINGISCCSEITSILNKKTTFLSGLWAKKSPVESKDNATYIELKYL